MRGIWNLIKELDTLLSFTTVVRDRSPRITKRMYYGRIVLVVVYLVGGTAVFWPAGW